MQVSPSLAVADLLHAFVEQELLPGTGVDPAGFWASLESLLKDFQPRNRALLERRDTLQSQIDEWWKARKGQPFDLAAQTDFLTRIGYLLPEPAPFTIGTQNVDPEIARIAGPQLVVPVSNGRYALNAANARWGSLYDALYGTDALEPPTGGKGYDPVRGAKVIAYARGLLDRAAPLAGASHSDAAAYAIINGALSVTLASGAKVALADPSQLAGWRGDASAPSAILLKHNGLHLEIQVDRSHNVGKDDPAGVSDVLMESALTAIQDCEDSVAAVDAEDKTGVYRNWLGLMRGDLAATFEKGGRTETRRLDEDRRYSTPGGGEIVLRGRSLLLVRNV
ncbi:MAG: malate synthase G, partial [Phenylobacterium sp.]|nr:malate synthase G [Phenylobacterium sp.]MCA6259294.1 malate synthase G [Phenylobacterium sp.]MCA6264109.1 malate synthase G [Phenylobacterium sp.]MCA6319342.1 malate synthase G [Phenylobacterium sp.]